MRGLKRKKERERSINVQEILGSVASHTPPTGDLSCNPGFALTWNQMTTFQFAGQHSMHTATPARADYFFITGSLYPLFPFSFFIQPLLTSPLATISLLFMSLFLFCWFIYFHFCFFFKIPQE